MESLPARKTRPSLVVEPLEDRWMLSMFAAAPQWDGGNRPMGNQAETGPISGGSRAPISGSGFDNANRGPVASFDSPGFADHQPSSLSADPTPGGWLSMPPDPTPSDDKNGNGTASSPGGFADPVASPGGVSSVGASSDETPVASSGADDRGAGSESASGAPSIAIAPVMIPLNLPTRSAPQFSNVRSAPELLSSSARGEVSSTASPSSRASADETLLAIATANTATTGASSSTDQARVQALVNLPIGPGLISPQASPSQAFGPSKDPVDLPKSVEVPIGSGAEARWTISQSGAGSLVEAQPNEVIALPEPDLAGMIQSFLPFDRSTMADVVDRFLEPWDGLASTLPELRSPMGLITASLAAAATVVAVEVAIRLRKTREAEFGSDDIEGLSSFPGFDPIRPKTS